MAKMNIGRVIQGGLLAGIVINLISILDNVVILGPKIMAARQAGKLLLKPQFPFMPAWVVAMFLLGLELIWLYAAVRPRFGPGPKTALALGIVVGVLSAVLDNLANAAWGLSGRYLPFMWAVERVVACAIGTLVGAWWYREEGSTMTQQGTTKERMTAGVS